MSLIKTVYLNGLQPELPIVRNFVESAFQRIGIATSSNPNNIHEMEIIFDLKKEAGVGLYSVLGFTGRPLKISGSITIRTAKAGVIARDRINVQTSYERIPLGKTVVQVLDENVQLSVNYEFNKNTLQYVMDAIVAAKGMPLNR